MRFVSNLYLFLAVNPTVFGARRTLSRDSLGGLRRTQVVAEFSNDSTLFHVETERLHQEDLSRLSTFEAMSASARLVNHATPSPSVSLSPTSTSNMANPLTLTPTTTPQTFEPTLLPTAPITAAPTVAATVAVTVAATYSPTPAPTPWPTRAPTDAPSFSPVTSAPTLTPTVAQTASSTLTYCGGLTTEQRIEQITAILLTVSSETELLDNTTPQGKAFEWITSIDPLQLCPDASTCQLVQRYSLAVFYYSTEGDEWDNCSAGENSKCVADPNVEDWVCNPVRWLSNSSECEWCGNTCNDDSCMIGVDIERNNLGGTLPDELSSLGNLTWLVLEQGFVNSPIPSSYGALTQLEKIDMDFQELSGPIPDSIYSLINLRQLDLNNNTLSGTISTLIGNLQKLGFLQLHANQMSGTIPSELGSIPYLIVSDLYYNNFTGTMPEEVCAHFYGIPDKYKNFSSLQVSCSVQCDVNCCTDPCV